MSSFQDFSLMKRLLVLGLLPLLIFSCQKVETNEKQTCFKGRFVAEGCLPVIQVLDSLNESIPTTQYGIYERAIGVRNLPEQYKDGHSFYFAISYIDSNMIFTANCLRTRYFVEISSISDTPCSKSEKE